MTPLTLSIKIREGSKWQPLPLALAGMPLGVLCLQLTGQEAVGELVLAGQKCYLSGTNERRERMAAKGPAFTFAQAADRLRGKECGDAIPVPLAGVIEDVFPGCRLEVIEYLEATDE